jgi:hypothetical protein
MLGNNFGLGGDFEGTRRMLKRFHRVTRAGGRIIATTLDLYDTSEHLHHEYHAKNRARGRMAGQARIRMRYGKYRTPWSDYLFVSKAEMEQLLEDTGWRAGQYVDSTGPGYAAVIERD